MFDSHAFMQQHLHLLPLSLTPWVQFIEPQAIISRTSGPSSVLYPQLVLAFLFRPGQTQLLFVPVHTTYLNQGQK